MGMHPEPPVAVASAYEQPDTIIPRQSLRHGEQLALRAAAVLLLATIIAAALHLVFDTGGPSVDAIVRDWASSLVYVLAAAIVMLRAVRVRQARGPWLVIGVGLSLYGVGNLLWALWFEHMASPPIPSASDGLWLALYPASYVGLVWLARGAKRRASAGVWLDGIVAGLGIAALGAAVVVGPVLSSAAGPAAAVATNLAYPVGDLVLAALVIGILAFRGWRLDRCWAMLGAGFLALCVADIIYLLHVAGGAPDSSLLANVFYLSGVALLALAAWQPTAGSPARSEGLSVLLIPVAFAVMAVGVFLYDHFNRLDPVAISLATLTVLGVLVRTALTFRDVRALAETRRQATTDDLTSLPNRRLFMHRAAQAISAALASGGSAALFIIDLDHFKELNDTLGHHAGDALLRQIGPRMQGSLRATDTLARLGGDEFGLLVGSPCDEAAARRVADKLLAGLREPFVVEGMHLRVTASIGIALYPAHATDAEQLLQRADVAMYQAKVGQTGHELYARARDNHSRANLALGTELPAAIAGGELELHFQPIAEARGRGIRGMEALVRWRHPDRGLLAPATFVPLAEQLGMIRDLTQWVLDTALAQCKAWQDEGHELVVSVNVAAADLLDSEFPAQVARALARHDVDPDALVLEVTESSVMSDPARISDVLARLGELGVGISLDDFGTGYSSLVHLKTLPVSEVKIDRSFVSRMRIDETDLAIVRSTIQLAHNLGMRVVAEGVEDDATWADLADLGCELIQGYRLSRPLPAAELTVLLPLEAMAPRA